MIDESLIPSLVVVGVGWTAAVLRFVLQRDMAIRRAVWRVKATRVCDVRDGEVVRLVGKLRFLDPPLAAVLSGRRCAHYRATARGKSAYTSIDERGSVDFLLDDGTGHARVSTTAAAFLVARDWNTSATDTTVTDEMAALLRRHDDLTRWLSGLSIPGEYHFHERVLDEGDEVTVLGLATVEPDDHPEGIAMSGSYREAPMRVAIVAPSGGTVKVAEPRAMSELLSGLRFDW